MELNLMRYALCLLALTSCVCLGLITLRTMQVLHSTDAAVQATQHTIAALPHELQLTRKLIADSRDQVLTTTNTHLDRLQSLLEERSSKLQETLDLSQQNIAIFGNHAAWELRQANVTLASLKADLAPPIEHMDHLIQEADDLTARINVASQPLLDCKGNGACLPSQTLALMGSARYTMGQIARAAPETTVAVKDATKSIAKIADHVSKKQPWYSRIFGLIRIISAAKIFLL